MNTSPHVIDATDVDFQEKVLVKSREVPVLVDFWATWCGPCKTLGPVLEKLADEYAGRFQLVKIDIDRSPQVAMAFRVQSVPTVYLVKDGQPIDGFQGGQTETAIRQLLDRHLPAAAVDPMIAAEAALADNQLDAAARGFRAVLETEPTHGDALIGMARVAMGMGDQGAMSGWLDQIPAESPAFSKGERLRGLLAFSEDAGDISTLEAAVAQNAEDADAWYRLGATYAVGSRFELSFAAFLKVVSLDRELREDGGRKALLSLFELVGAEDDIVIKARRRLASLLF